MIRFQMLVVMTAVAVSGCQGCQAREFTVSHSVSVHGKPMDQNPRTDVLHFKLNKDPDYEKIASRVSHIEVRKLRARITNPDTGDGSAERPHNTATVGNGDATVTDSNGNVIVLESYSGLNVVPGAFVDAKQINPKAVDEILRGALSQSTEFDITAHSNADKLPAFFDFALSLYLYVELN